MKKKKDKNRARTSIAAVGAVVAAGLTPGMITGTPATQPQSPEAELTAADVVSINGEVFDFDDLFALNQVRRSNDQRHKTVYGPPPAQIERSQKEREEAARREQVRLDSIRRAQESQALVYGPPSSFRFDLSPEWLRQLAANDQLDAHRAVLNSLMDYCSEMPQFNTGQTSLANRDLIKDLKLDAEQLEGLCQEIENSCGVLVTAEMLKQLGTMQRIATFIVEVASPIKD